MKDLSSFVFSMGDVLSHASSLLDDRRVLISNCRNSIIISYHDLIDTITTIEMRWIVTPFMFRNPRNISLFLFATTPFDSLYNYQNYCFSTNSNIKSHSNNDIMDSTIKMSASTSNNNHGSSGSQLILLEKVFAKLNSNPDEILLLDGGTGEEVSNCYTHTHKQTHTQCK